MRGRGHGSAGRGAARRGARHAKDSDNLWRAIRQNVRMDRVCGHGESLARGKFLLLNNLWGARDGRGTQCLVSEAAVGPDGSVAWSTSWDWEGPPDSVKSYVSALLGWHWGWPKPGSGLPIRTADLAQARSDWALELTSSRPGRLNVSYDIWLAGVPDPSMDDLSDEVMIWLHREGGPTPIGRVSGTVDVDGARWELWEGPHPSRGWMVHSFVRTESAAGAAGTERAASAISTSLDLKAFLDHLAPRMPDATYLVGIEAGAEIFYGAGSLETTCYAVSLAGA